MDKTQNQNNILFQIVFSESENKRVVYALEKVRTTIGSSDVCDIKIKRPDISAIHAVMEIKNGKPIIYDLSSTNGTYVNGEKIVYKEIQENGSFFLSNHEFKILKFKEADIIPPLLKTLPKLKSDISRAQIELPPEFKAGTKVAKPEKTDDGIPKIVFPLSSDPLADKTEYIFEDADLVLPIFKYDTSKSAVEVVIIHNDLVYSVDYLPNKDSIYKISGIKNNNTSIEFPYFGKTELFPLVEIKGDILIHAIPSFERQVLSDRLDLKTNNSTPIVLGASDIVRFQNRNLQIFIRRTDSPPQVDSAPLFSKDRDFSKYLLLMMLFALVITVSFNLIQIEKPIEKEVAPERIASIIYKKKTPLEKIPESKIEVQEKPPEIKPENNSIDAQKTQNVAPVEKIADKIPEKVTGSKTAPKVKVVKKATPPPGPQDKLDIDVVRPKPSDHLAKKGTPGGSAKSSPSKSSAKSQGNVETFNIAGLSGSLNSLLSKGGGTKSALNTGSGSGIGSGSGGEVDGVKGSLYDSGGPSATLQRSKVTGQTGSLTGSAQGSMDISKGAEGISDKKNIYTAGLPYRTIVLGGLDPDIIRKILIEHLEQFRYCYQKQLDQENRIFSGVVRMNFIIGATGNVTKAAVETSDSSISPEIRGCVGNVLKGIQFPAPRGGGVVEVNQPFNFYPKQL